MGLIALFVVNLVSKMYHLDDAVLVEFHPASRFSNPEVTSYFERAYALCKKYYDISNELIDSWNKNDKNFWPYAGAKTIDNNSLLITFFMNHFIHLKTRWLLKIN